MSFDALTLSAVRDELEPRLVDARIQKLVFIDELSLALECFAPPVGRTNVLLSADLEHARVQRISQLKLPGRGLERDSPFTLLIRKHLRNARIRAVHQPRLERVFELDCEQRDATGQLYRVVLIVEAMGRRSNLVLVDQDGTILDAARRAPPGRNPRRPVLPHLPYVAPPPQERLMPAAITSESLSTDGTESLAKHLAARIAGLSPLAARELAYRAVSDANASRNGIDWAHVAAIAREFLGVIDTHRWEPTLALDADRPIDYAPYILTHLESSGARLIRFASTSEAIDAFHTRLAEAAPARRGDPLLAERKALLAPLERTARTTERRISALSHQLELGHAEREPLRRAGEAILAHQTELPPASTELTIDGERFGLDPRLSAIENAQAYFARYRKAREAEERVPELLDEARNLVAYLAELRTLVEVADRMDAIRALRREVGMATGGSKQQPARRSAKQAPRSAPYRRVLLAEGWEALVGASAEGNAEVTFGLARADDLWLHARGVPGAHVILRGNGSEPPDELVERAAAVAAQHSAARGASAVEVDVAPRRYVKKIPGGAPGLVRYANERTIRVTPRSA